MGSRGAGDDRASNTTALPVQPPKPGKAMSIVVLLFGFAIVGIGAYSFVADSASLDNHVEVTAEVVGTGVEQVESSRGRDAYIPTVTFQYRFQGTGYTSNRLYPGSEQPRYGDRETARSFVSEYTAGETVTAFVDPESPGEAYLEATRSGQATGALVAGVLVSLLGGVGLWQARQEAPKR